MPLPPDCWRAEKAVCRGSVLIGHVDEDDVGVGLQFGDDARGELAGGLGVTAAVERQHFDQRLHERETFNRFKASALTATRMPEPDIDIAAISASARLCRQSVTDKAQFGSSALTFATCASPSSTAQHASVSAAARSPLAVAGRASVACLRTA